MKRENFFVAVLRLAICALLIASANQSVNASESKSSKTSGAIFATSAADGGRLYIRRSPVLGYNVQIALTIDGKNAGTLVRGRTYDKYIAPGHRILVVTPRPPWPEWRTVLDVRPGQTYSYTARFTGLEFVLTPTGGPL